MDLSKLPRLSETSKEKPESAAADQISPEAPSPHPKSTDALAAPIGSTGDAWISIAVGVIILLLSPRLLQYILAPGTFGEKWTFRDVNGVPLAYLQTVFFWGDLVLYLFAAALIVEGLILAFARRALPIAIGFGLTVVATLANATYVVYMLMQNFGVQLYSLLAVAFGVYIGIYQWNLLKGFAAMQQRHQ